MLQKLSIMTGKNFFNNKKNSIQCIENILSKYNTNPNLKFNISKNTNVKFYQTLVDIYNSKNYYANAEDREDIGLIDKIYNAIKKPTQKELNLLEFKNVTLSLIYQIIEKNTQKPNTIDFIIKLYNEVLLNASNQEAKVITDLLNSKNLDEYSKNYDKYLPYLLLNKKEPNVVEELDILVDNKTYDKEKYKKLNELKNIYIVRIANEDSILHANNIINYYNKDGNLVLKALDQLKRLNKTHFEPNFEQSLMQIYTTSNSKNAKCRNLLLKRFDKSSDFTNISNEELQEKIDNYIKLFEKIDNDKHAYSFINKVLFTHGIQDVEMINSILDNISSFKLSVFYNNALNIIEQVNKEELIDKLNNNLTDTSFETPENRHERLISEKYKFSKPKSFISKTIDYINNSFNILYYKTKTLLNPSLTKPTYISSEKIISKNQPKTETYSKNIFINSTPEDNNTKQSKIKTENKKKISDNILNIAKNKLGAKTYAKQQNDFGLYANNIRLKLLPEIFASITDTRKTDKAVGKRKSNSKNSDALQLYMLINGNNKKLVNYLLKKRNVDNTRMFEVKDIINILKKAEDKIATKKKNNPEYKAKDTRAYYNHLYEAKIQEYGKVKNIKNQKNI